MWTKLDDGFYDNPKVIEAGLEATGLYVLCLTWTSKHRKGGSISHAAIARFAGVRAAHLSDILLSVGLFENAEGGFEIHDYLEYNPSPETIAAKEKEISEKRAEAGRHGAESRWRDSKTDSKHGKLNGKTDSKDAGNNSKSLTNSSQTPLQTNGPESRIPSPESRVPNPYTQPPLLTSPPSLADQERTGTEAGSAPLPELDVGCVGVLAEMLRFAPDASAAAQTSDGEAASGRSRRDPAQDTQSQQDLAQSAGCSEQNIAEATWLLSQYGCDRVRWQIRAMEWRLANPRAVGPIVNPWSYLLTAIESSAGPDGLPLPAPVKLARQRQKALTAAMLVEETARQRLEAKQALGAEQERLEARWQELSEDEQADILTEAKDAMLGQVLWRDRAKKRPADWWNSPGARIELLTRRNAILARRNEARVSSSRRLMPSTTDLAANESMLPKTNLKMVQVAHSPPSEQAA
jgi:hypothetical protein